MEADLIVPEGWVLDVRNNVSGLTTFYLVKPIQGDVQRYAFELFVLGTTVHVDGIDMFELQRSDAGAPIGHRRYEVSFDDDGKPVYADDAAKAWFAKVPNDQAVTVMELATTIKSWYLVHTVQTPAAP